MKAGVASRRVETKMKERESGVRVVRWPTLTFWKLPKAHGLPNMVFGLDLQTRQLPSLQDSRSALTFRSPNMVVFLGVSSTFMLQPVGKSPNPWRHHGKFHNPLVWFYVAGEYYSSVLEYFLGPNINIYMSNSTQGYQSWWSWQLAPTAWPINMSLGLFSYIVCRSFSKE